MNREPAGKDSNTACLSRLVQNLGSHAFQTSPASKAIAPAQSHTQLDPVVQNYKSPFSPEEPRSSSPLVPHLPFQQTRAEWLSRASSGCSVQKGVGVGGPEGSDASNH